MSIIRRAAVAGKFYPENPIQLETEVLQMLASARPPDCTPKILIAPHAGYMFSGPIAASAYATLKPRREEITRVVILGTCHVPGITKIATTEADSFETPLGHIQTDMQSIHAAVHGSLAVVHDKAQQLDHAIEVQLPFLQLCLDEFTIAPFLVSSETPTRQVTELIELIWGGDETIFIISSDLSHYQTFDQATSIDRQTAEFIVRLNDSKLNVERACGFRAIAGAIQVAQKQTMKCILLDLRNSGDTAGSHDRVVGYGAFAFCPTAAGPQVI